MQDKYKVHYSKTAENQRKSENLKSIQREKDTFILNKQPNDLA